MEVWCAVLENVMRQHIAKIMQLRKTSQEQQDS